MTERRFPPMPDNIKALPIDARGYPVPYFVAWVDGKPDHRIIDPSKLWPAVQDHLCWICGQPLGQGYTFPIGPLGTITRTSSEPPSHLECVEFAAKVCPFLAIPSKDRRLGGLPDNVSAPPGEFIMRNPGVLAAWVCENFQPYMVDNGLLFRIGDAKTVRWYSQGRAAYRYEVEDAIATGLPHLLKMAMQDGDEGMRELFSQIMTSRAYLPAHVAVSV